MKKHHLFYVHHKTEIEHIATTPSHGDWSSLVGLLLLTGLMGLASLSMVVDVSALAQILRLKEQPLVNLQENVAEHPSNKLLVY